MGVTKTTTGQCAANEKALKSFESMSVSSQVVIRGTREQALGAKQVRQPVESMNTLTQQPRRSK